MKHYLLFFAFISLISGCAHQPIPREASEYLLTTDRDAVALLKAIRTALEEKKYTVSREDVPAGLLVVAPRRFSFDKNGSKIAARQSINMRQEGGSLKIRITYDCNYAGDERTFVTCFSEDAEATAKIKRIEPALIQAIKPHLMKHADPEDESVQ